MSSEERCNVCGGQFRRAHPLSSIMPALECEDCGRMIPRGALESNEPEEQAA